ncbi:MAG: metallophosphoesterase, partial [Candidatus Magasanikiibacteriota bacterium]
MKILHTADLHKNTKRYHDLEVSLDVIEETSLREKVDAILIAGDLYDGAEQNSEIGLHTPFARRIQRLADIAPVAIVKGTPTHDIPGSLDGFELLACEYGVTILQPGQIYLLGDEEIEEGDEYVGSGHKAILFGLPEPGRSWVAARTVDDKAKTGDEINAELRQIVSRILLGYGAKRQQYPDLPCLFMYHGQVRGCRLSNGTTLPDGPVSADDLRQVGFDYGALGDIHEPQQIPGLPAYYPGSVYTDWGEYHKAGCNLVEIVKAGGSGGGALFDLEAGFNTSVTRVDFPHPQRVKFTVSLEEFDNTSWPSKIDGRLAWVEIHDKKDACDGLDIGYMTAEVLIKDSDALPGSRVSLDPIPVETVRAGEIAKKVTLSEKVALQGENSFTPYAPSVLAKAAEIEAAVGSLAALAGPEKRFRNVWSRIRGSRGFWWTQGKDEVFIPWAELGEGVIPYVGPNGNGKTTSYDFGKPWPVPVTRPPKTLKAHFRLRDSAIENVFLEEVSGICYRTLVNIDGANKSGDAKYFFYRGPSSDGPWTPYSEESCTGRQDGFFTAVDEVFGSMAIYMRTAFAAQTPTPDFPDIARATKEEKKDLISELAGKDYAPYRDYATGKVKAGENDLVALNATIAAGVGIEEEIAENNDIAVRAGQDVEESQALAQASETQAKILAAEVDALTFRLQELESQARRKGEIEAEIETLVQEIKTSEAEARGFQAAADARGEAEATLAKIKDL